MTRLTTFVTIASALCSLPPTSAWTFTWRDSSNDATTAKGTGGQSCTVIDQPDGKYWQFDTQDDLVRLYLYSGTKCTDIILKEDNDSSNTSTGSILAFAVINLAGANTSYSGPLEPFPGADWFKTSPNSPIITAMGERLVQEGCSNYTSGPGPQWSVADKNSYQCWQEKLGYCCADADGWPGSQTWQQLKVPQVDETSTSSTTTTTTSSTPTPSSTPTGTNVTASTTPTPIATPVPDSALSGGAIGGIVVGSVVGLGLIGAIIYLARRIRRKSDTPAKDEEPEQKTRPETGRGPERVDGGYAAVAAVSPAGSTKSSIDHLVEAEAIPLRYKESESEKKNFVELPGDTRTPELSDSRRIMELSESRRVNELSDSRRVNELANTQRLNELE